MARSHSTYSRVVAWLKILLPLVALGVLGTVFLFNRQSGFEAGFSFSKADIESLEPGSFLLHPEINGITRKGEPFHLSADKIRPLGDGTNLVEIINMQTNFRFNSGAWAKVSTNKALMDTEAQTVWFEEGGRLETSDGNIAEVQSLHLLMEKGELQGTGIVANGPLGHLSAENFRIESHGGENRVLWLENNVRMVYDLQNARE